jgi:hypothetical protein
MEPSQILFIAGASILMAMGLIVVTWKIQGERLKQKRTQGILCIQALRAMLMHIQQHRGLSTTVIGGVGNLLSSLAEVQRTVSRDLGHISLISDWIKDNPNWQAVTAHWARLAGNYQRLDIRKNLDQHNRLVRGILVFIDEVAEAHFLSGLSGSPTNSVSWRYLLGITEDLGQIRAVGLAYIAATESGDGAPRLRNTLQALVAEFLITLNQLEFARLIPQALQEKILQFIVRFPEALLDNPKFCMVNQYYEAATEVVDDLYLIFDSEMKNVLITLS